MSNQSNEYTLESGSKVNKMKTANKATKKDFDKAVDEFCKFSKVVFAGSDEKRKLELLDGMKSLMNSKPSVKRPIEVADNDSEAKRLKLTAFELPNEMWLKILSYLKNRDIYGAVALVSKRFHGFTIDPSIMKFLHIEITSNKWKSINLYRKCMKVVKRSTTLSGEVLHNTLHTLHTLINNISQCVLRNIFEYHISNVSKTH